MRTNGFLVLALALFYSLNSYANYYSPSDEGEFLSGSQSDGDLSHTIKVASSRGFHALGYKRKAKKELYGFVELKQDQEGYYVFDVYCHQVVRKSVGPNRIPNNKQMNTEHTWPQSLGSKAEPKRGDLHHLFPTNSRANSVRSSYIFGEVQGKDAFNGCPTSQIGRIIDPVSGSTRGKRAFQPPAEHRGNVARALFYFATRYNYKISSDEEYYLRKWHTDDPVDDEELDRNEKVMKVQGNRNPFIDFPNLVGRISNF